MRTISGAGMPQHPSTRTDRRYVSVFARNRPSGAEVGLDDGRHDTAVPHQGWPGTAMVNELGVSAQVVCFSRLGPAS